MILFVVRAGIVAVGNVLIICAPLVKVILKYVQVQKNAAAKLAITEDVTIVV